jgi:hypothetical protein
LNELFSELIQVAFLWRVVFTNQLWDHKEVLNVDAELISAAPTLTVLNDATAWIPFSD